MVQPENCTQEKVQDDCQSNKLHQTCRANVSVLCRNKRIVSNSNEIKHTKPDPQQQALRL